MKRGLATAFAAVLPIAPATAAVPAAEAAPAPPVITITYPSSAYDRGDASRNGAQFEPFGALPSAAQVGYLVTGEVTANEPGGGLTFGSKLVTWLACPTRQSPSANCEILDRRLTEDAFLSGVIGEESYRPTSASIGKYLRMDVKVGSQISGMEASKSGTGNGQLLVWPAKAAGSEPTFVGKRSATSRVTVSLKPWTLATGTAFQSRTVNVYSCPSAANGQSDAYAWNPAADGCTDVSSGLAVGVNTPAAADVAFTVPAGTEGRFLVVSDLMVASWGNGNVTGAVVRSDGAQVASPVAPEAAVPADASTPSADSSSSSPAPSTPDADASTPSGTGVSAAIAARPSAKPGGGLKVVVSTSSAQSAGKATVSLKRSPKLKAPTVQVLKKVSIVNGTGQSVTKLRRTLSRGTYYVVAKFTDANSGATAVATKKLTVR